MWQTHINKNFLHVMTLIDTHLTGLETIHIIMTLILTSNTILQFLIEL
jgi:hypothetical protein